ncbi:MAG: tRNA pseudouridine(55) synthase TruB, partial [Pseudomonadota bacterium]
AVTRARRALGAQKAGHAGTLDPLATGVLAIALGEATKTAAHAMEGAKTYRFTVRWGEARDTDDAEGDVLETRAARPSPAEIDAALAGFRGVVMQRPPGFSAIKVDGARAYDLARAGAAPDLPARPIRIDALELVETPDADHAVLDMTCGKGGYVRAVARDLGAALGCLGHVRALRRVRAGPFRAEDAISFDLEGEFDDRERLERALLPVAAGLDDIPAFEVDEGRAAQIAQGRAVPLTGAVLALGLSYGDAAWAACNGRPVALGVVKAGTFQPTRVLNLTDEDAAA